MRVPLQSYVGLVGASLGTAVAVGVVGLFPTLRIAGRAGVPAMIGGIAVSLVGSVVGSIPIALSRTPAGAGTVQAVLAATALRFVIVLALTVGVVLADWLDRATLVVWVGVSYLALLVPDTLYAMRVASRHRGNPA